MSSAAKNAGATKKADARALLLRGIAVNAQSLEAGAAMQTRLMVRAVKSGLSQTEVANAAGVSQAHVSRVLAADRKRSTQRKATSAAKKGTGRGRV